jgi:hypothetical protein
MGPQHEQRSALLRWMLLLACCSWQCNLWCGSCLQDLIGGLMSCKQQLIDTLANMSQIESCMAQ